MSVSMKEMLEAGVHFGHQSRFWNPKMAPYIFGTRNKIHIINLEKTQAMFNEALNYISGIAAKKGDIMFVGTKRAARTSIQEEAIRVDMPYVDYRWLGGMITNFKTVKRSIKRLKDIDAMQMDGSINRLTKKEGLKLGREQTKLQNTLGGIKEMRRLPDAIFIVDILNEKNALMEAKKLGIPVIAIVDTNVDPRLVDYPIPGNDDGIRAIKLYTRAVADAIVDGQGTITTAAVEDKPAKKPAAKKAPAKKAEPKAEAIDEKAEKAPEKKAEVKEDKPAKKPAAKKAPAKKAEPKAAADEKTEKAPESGEE